MKIKIFKEKLGVCIYCQSNVEKSWNRYCSPICRWKFNNLRMWLESEKNIDKVKKSIQLGLVDFE